MKLHEPFCISARLLPALRLGDSWMSLNEDDDIVIDTPDFSYTETGFSWGFIGHPVDKFECALGFLQAAVEAMRYRRDYDGDSENIDLFPYHVMEWALDHASEIEEAQCMICDEDGNANTSLIEV